MIRLEYTHVVSNNFISKCLRHITLFTIFYYIHTFQAFIYFAPCVFILVCERWDIKPEMQLCKSPLFIFFLWCFSLYKDTTPPQPNHTVTPTHIEPEKYNTWNKSTVSRKLLKMDVLTFETCWAVNSEITKQVTSSWSIFIQPFNFLFLKLDLMTANNF